MQFYLLIYVKSAKNTFDFDSFVRKVYSFRDIYKFFSHVILKFCKYIENFIQAIMFSRCCLGLAIQHVIYEISFYIHYDFTIRRLPFLAIWLMIVEKSRKLSIFRKKL